MRVAILGSGQLARMLALAGMPLGMNFCFMASPDEDRSAVAGLGEVITLSGQETAEQLYAALGDPDVVTVEREQCDVAVLQQLATLCPVRPNATAFYQCQHRWREKQALVAAEVPHTPFLPVRNAAELTLAVDQFGLPLVIKHTEQGYDGKAQWRLSDSTQVEAFLQQAVFVEGAEDVVSYVAEPLMNFEREVSLLAVRSLQGEMRFYPLTENLHINGVLMRSVAPAPQVPQSVIESTQNCLARLMAQMDYVGVMAMECFLRGDQWWVNELAPRVHNSGHWTMQSAVTSQFENHMRAVAGWPLGNTELEGAAGMLNLLGIPVDQNKVLAEDVSLHWYNKGVRPGRKVGHLVLRDDSASSVLDRLVKLQQWIYG